MTLLNELPPSSRVWIFKAGRFLTEDEISQIQNEIALFMPQWAAHGKKLYAAGEIVDALWLVIALDQTKENASGCSIDSLTRWINTLEQKWNLSFTNRLLLAYADQDQIKLAPLQNLTQHGLHAQSLVYDDTVQTLGEFFNRKVKAQDCWVKRFL